MQDFITPNFVDTKYNDISSKYTDSENTAYFVVVLGKEFVGKTTWLDKLRDATNDESIYPTSSYTTCHISFHTSKTNTIEFTVLDTPGKRTSELDRINEMMRKADAVIIMGDDSSTTKEFMHYTEIWRKQNKDSLIVYVMNKCENMHTIPGIDAIYISSQQNININAPFLFLARQFHNKANMNFY